VLTGLAVYTGGSARIAHQSGGAGGFVYDSKTLLEIGMLGCLEYPIGKEGTEIWSPKFLVLGFMPKG
jgi:hypothetical protein